MRTAFLVFLALTFSSANAEAKQPVAALDFGQFPLGTQFTTAPAGMSRSDHCLVQPNYIDCEFKGRDGIYYLIYGTTLERKALRRESNRFPVRLPFEIEANDSLAAVKAKIESRFQIELLHLPPNQNLPNDVLTTRLAPINSLGETFIVNFVFDESGQLIKIEGQIPSEAD